MTHTFSAKHLEMLPSGHHVSEADYARHLTKYVSNDARVTYLLARRQFVTEYPDLNQWCQAPLITRVRGSAPKQQMLPYDATHYLLYLILEQHMHIDLEWLIGVRRLDMTTFPQYEAVQAAEQLLVQDGVRLGYQARPLQLKLRWCLVRLGLYIKSFSLEDITSAVIDEMEATLQRMSTNPEMKLLRIVRNPNTLLAHWYTLRTVLYQRGQIDKEPTRRQRPTKTGPEIPVRMQVVIDRYIQTRHEDLRRAGVRKVRYGVKSFVTWLVAHHPEIEGFSQVKREHVLEYQSALKDMITRRGTLYSPSSRLSILSSLGVFFRHVVEWGWEDVPTHILLQHQDLPKLPERIPRFIPSHELPLLMEEIRGLTCPFQRAALLIARWSGARRDEIGRLSVDCLDSYADGTPRLRIPAGKTLTERLVPLHNEAVQAIQVLLDIHVPQRGRRDRITGEETEYLFMTRGRLLSLTYLFDQPLSMICEKLGWIGKDGKLRATAHRFRHTVGRELGESGARIQTIMRLLGHETPGMSMVYVSISDQTMLDDYQAVVGKDAMIAGPYAETIRTQELSADDVDWLKTNFLKTALELGHCLRHPREGPCECDLYLSCAKFVTSQAYAPRLHERRQLELLLVDDACARGWERDAERHRANVRRIESLLRDLGELADD